MYSSVLYRALERRMETDLDNLYFLRFDAKYLDTVFDIHEVDKIYLNFSDPWPKDRHAKRRLTSPYFLALYDRILSKNGNIQFKTDNRPLFDFSVESVAQSGNWHIDEITYDLHHSEFLYGNVMTEYESRFVAEGKPICRFAAAIALQWLRRLSAGHKGFAIAAPTQPAGMDCPQGQAEY